MRWLRSSRGLLGALVLVALAVYLARMPLPSLGALDAPHAGWLAVSLMLFVIANYAFLRGWWHVRGAPGPLSEQGGAWFASLLARYLPGGFWQVGVRAVGARQHGGSAGDAIAVFIVEQGVVCLSLASLALIAVGVGALAPPHWLVAGLFAVAVGAVAGVAVASWLRDRPFPLRALLWIAAGHVLLAMGIAAVMRSWLPAQAATVLAFASSYLIAGLAGILAILVPAGLGVREAVVVWLMTPELATPAALALALFARVWLIGAELLAWLSWTLVTAWRRRAG